MRSQSESSSLHAVGAIVMQLLVPFIVGHFSQRWIGDWMGRHRALLGMVDRVLYLAGGRFRVGPPDEVLRSDVLSELYGSPVDVIRARGRVIVVGTPDGGHTPHDEHHDAGHEEVCDHTLEDEEAVVP